MIKISSFAKAKSNSNGNNNASSGGVVVPTVIMKKTPNVRIWGQWHDHTGDVNGDMTVEGKIDATGDITTQSSVIGKKGDFEDIVSETLKTTDIQATNIVSDNGFINNMSASSINTDSIEAKYGRYDELLVENLTGENGTFHNLTVTGKAHFFELVIDKITASGGAVIFSPADGFEVEKVIWLVNSSTDYLNIPATFLLPTNYHLIDYNNLNYTRAIIDVGGNKSNAFVVRPYNTTLDMDWYYFWETGELMRQDKIVELKYPDLYGEYKVIESSFPKVGVGVYNYKYEIVEEDTNEYLYNLSYPDGYALIDYKKLKISVCGHDIDGNRVEVDDTIKYATKVWVNEKEQFWFYEEDNLVTDLSTLYTKYNNLWQSYTRTYTPSITTYPIAKSFFTLNPYLLFLAENEQGRAIRNEWQVNDQAICRNFNEAKVGSSQNVKNKYYWGLVIETDYIDTNLAMQFDQIYIDKDGNLIGDYLAEEQFHIYHAIALDASDYDGVLDCEPGDAIAMLGNRTDKDRQKAIYISSYTSLDPSLEAPLFCQYTNIDSFSLSGKKLTWFSKNGNHIEGELVVRAIGDPSDIGKSVEDLINDKGDELSNEFQDWIDNTNSKIDEIDDRLKVLPTTDIVGGKIRTYSSWQSTIGSSLSCRTACTKPANSIIWYVDGERTTEQMPILKNGDIVAIEISFSNLSDNHIDKGTLVGEVINFTKPSIISLSEQKYTFSTTVKCQYILNGDLSDVWKGMSELSVKADSIQATVTDLKGDVNDNTKGIAQLTIRAGNIETSVSNLKGDISSIDQKADSILATVNKNYIELSNKGFTIGANTIVDGTLTVDNGHGFKMVNTNGDTLNITSTELPSYNNFVNKSNDSLTISDSSENNQLGKNAINIQFNYGLPNNGEYPPEYSTDKNWGQMSYADGYWTKYYYFDKTGTKSAVSSKTFHLLANNTQIPITNFTGKATILFVSPYIDGANAVLTQVKIVLINASTNKEVYTETIEQSRGIFETTDVKIDNISDGFYNRRATVEFKLRNASTLCNVSVASIGDYKIEIRPVVLFNARYNVNSGSFGLTTNCYSYISCNLTIPCANSSQLAVDGYDVNFGNNSHIYLGESSSIIKYGASSKIEIDSNECKIDKFKICNPNYLVDTNNLVFNNDDKNNNRYIKPITYKIKELYNTVNSGAAFWLVANPYVVDSEDDIIFCSYNGTIILPLKDNKFVIGNVVNIVNFSGGNVTIRTTTNDLNTGGDNLSIKYNSGNSVAKYTLANNKSVKCVKAFNSWYIF